MKRLKKLLTWQFLTGLLLGVFIGYVTFHVILMHDLEKIKKEQKLMNEDVQRILELKKEIAVFNDAYNHIIETNRKNRVPEPTYLASGEL